MSKQFKPRDVGATIQILRDFLLGRKHTLAVRFEPWCASRSPPPPNLPEGPAAKLANNYYVTRDVRREVVPPTVITDAKLISSATEPESSGPAPPVKVTPGKVFMWD